MKTTLAYFILLLFSKSVLGQFSFTEDKLRLRIYNKNNILVKNAEISVNGFALKQCTECKYYSDGFCYELELKNIKTFIHPFGMVKLNFSHPDYQSINDSVYITGQYFYVLTKNDNYVYEYNKIPYFIHQNHYFVEVRDSVQFESRMNELKIPVLNKYLYCQGFMKWQSSGPLIYIVKVSNDNFSKFSNLSTAAFFSYGLLISRDTNIYSRNCTGISNKIAFKAKNFNSKSEIETFLKTMPEVLGFYLDPYNQVYYEVTIKQEFINDIISITEKILKSGYFQMPLNHLMIYKCPA